VGIAIAVSTFVFFLPKIANYSEVWDVVKELSWPWAIALLAAVLLNLATFAPPWQVALQGERTSTRFKLETKPAYEIPIVLAALRGKMLELAVEQADGAFTNFLPLDGLPQVVEPLADAPEGFELLCRFFCLPGTREEVEPIARYMFSTYITVPVYTEFFKWLGWGERIQPMLDAWNAGDRQKAAAEAPWEAIEQMFIFGSPAEMKERLEAFVAGGITCPILTMVCPPEQLAGMIDDLAR